MHGLLPLRKFSSFSTSCSQLSVTCSEAGSVVTPNISISHLLVGIPNDAVQADETSLDLLPTIL